jgi:hypothetical protein
LRENDRQAEELRGMYSMMALFLCECYDLPLPPELEDV